MTNMRDKNDKRTIEEMQASFWASLDRMAEESKKRQAEFDKRQAEYEKQREKDRAEYEKRQAESNAAYEKRQAESNAEFEKRQAEYEKQRAIDKAEAQKSMEDLKNTIKETNRLLGNHGNNLGDIAEEYFTNSIKEGKTNIFGEKFDEIRTNYPKTNDEKMIVEDEYDILLINGKSICIIEIKYKANEKDIPSVLKKAETFRKNFPKYKNHKIYLGLATMAFYDELEAKCKENNIAMIKQVGDTIVVIEGKLEPH